MFFFCCPVPSSFLGDGASNQRWWRVPRPLPHCRCCAFYWGDMLLKVFKMHRNATEKSQTCVHVAYNLAYNACGSIWMHLGECVQINLKLAQVLAKWSDGQPLVVETLVFCMMKGIAREIRIKNRHGEPDKTAAICT